MFLLIVLFGTWDFQAASSASAPKPLDFFKYKGKHQISLPILRNNKYNYSSNISQKIKSFKVNSYFLSYFEYPYHKWRPLFSWTIILYKMLPSFPGIDYKCKSHITEENCSGLQIKTWMPEYECKPVDSPAKSPALAPLKQQRRKVAAALPDLCPGEAPCFSQEQTGILHLYRSGFESRKIDLWAGYIIFSNLNFLTTKNNSTCKGSRTYYP